MKTNIEIFGKNNMSLLQKSVLLALAFSIVAIAIVTLIVLIFPVKNLYSDTIISNENIVIGELQSGDVVNSRYEIQHSGIVELSLIVATYEQELTSGNIFFEVISQENVIKSGSIDHKLINDNSILTIGLSDSVELPDSIVELRLIVQDLSSPVTFWAGNIEASGHFVESMINGNPQQIAPAIEIKYEKKSFAYLWDLMMLFVFLNLVFLFMLFDLFDKTGAENENMA